jgi:hypothetical protein
VINVCAPFPGMDVPWSKEETSNLHEVLDKLVLEKIVVNAEPRKIEGWIWSDGALHKVDKSVV